MIFIYFKIYLYIPNDIYTFQDLYANNLGWFILIENCYAFEYERYISKLQFINSSALK